MLVQPAAPSLPTKAILSAGIMAVLSSVPSARGDKAAACSWFVDPITVKVMHDRRLPFASSVKHIDVAGMRGECERVQIWGWSDDGDLRDLTVAFADLTPTAAESAAHTPAGIFPKEQWSYKQQGYVNTSTSSRYNCIEDILTHKGGPYPPPPPPSPPGTDCDKTPFGSCWTGW